MKLFSVLAFLFVTQAFAASPGEALYQNSCAMCHGVSGVNPNPMYPNLAGQKENYVLQQLKDFRDKKRAGVMMPSMVAQFNDEQFAQMSKYIASLQACISNL